MQYNFNGNRDVIRKWALRGAVAVGGFAVLALLASLLLPEKADLAQAQQNRPAAPQQPAAPVPPAAPAAPAPTIRNFEDWAMQCERPQGAQRDSCYLFQQQVVTDSNQRLMLVTVGQLTPQGVPLVAITLPLGVRLPVGMAVKIDDNPQFAPTFQACMPDGCVATTTLDSAILRQLNSGKQGVVAFINHINGQRMDLPISLKGFANAYKALPTPPAVPQTPGPAATAQPAPAAPAPAGQQRAPANTPRR